MDLCDQPVFAAAFEAALQRHSHRSLEPRLLRQLLQVAQECVLMLLSVILRSLKSQGMQSDAIAVSS